jgi:hemolysin activation/secretion protein
MLTLPALPFCALLAPSRAVASDPAQVVLTERTPPLFIAQFLVHGVHSLSALEVETAVYPFLGPQRTTDDVRHACTALESAYRDKGFGAASVSFEAAVQPGGVVVLDVNEGTVERLRVTGAKFFSPDVIRGEAPSLAEGKTINFNDVNKDVLALNQLPDRTVTPTLTPGSQPGTYDIDLNVKDQAPLHASVEVNDYRSPNTVPLRVTASVSDTNLAQSGQGAGLSFEEAPQRRKDDEVLTAYYLARFAGLERWTFLFQGTKQDSNISTLGGATVAGPGETAEAEATIQLPNGTDWKTDKPWQDFSHSLSFGIDAKHYQQSLTVGASSAPIVTPITYFPLAATYQATLLNRTGKGSDTELSAGLLLNFRGVGSGPATFDLNRYGADGSFVTFRGTLSHLQPLPGDTQIFVRIQGQLANQPLVSSEEFSGGGEETVRGYLESETVGDRGEFATIELRSPRILGTLGKRTRDWRLYAFADAGNLTLIDPLPEQTSSFDLASVGLGSTLQIDDHLSGGFDAAYPLATQAYTTAHDIRVTFRADVKY